MSRALETRLNHGLTFIAVFAFVLSFFGSRLFATLNPTVVVVRQVGSSQVHFHHFWYGLAMVSASGWLGLTMKTGRYDRILALVYGLGAGFIGDEIGLLLTFGDYQSELTYQFFVGAVAFILLATLVVRYGKQLERDFAGITRKERLFQAGIFAMGFSGIFFASGNVEIGILTLSLGAAVTILGYERRRQLEKVGVTNSPSASQE